MCILLNVFDCSALRKITPFGIRLAFFDEVLSALLFGRIDVAGIYVFSDNSRSFGPNVGERN